MKQGLTRRLLLSFTAVLAVFALVVGGSFGYFFLKHTEEHHLADLRRLALSLAADMQGQPEAGLLTGGGEGSRRGRGMHHGMMHRAGTDNLQESSTAPETGQPRHCRRYYSSAPSDSQEGEALSLGRYLKQLNDISQCEVWVMDARTQDFSLYGEAAGMQYDEFSPAADEVVQQALQGRTVSSRDFTPLLSVPSLTIGTPLYGEDGNVRGVLLLHKHISDLQETQRQALLLFLLCLGAAFAASALLSLLLARRFLRPLQQMEAFAGELAAGKYGHSSGISRPDEIGSLARSLDTLSRKLEKARQQKEALDKMRQDFLASISHELRTPITVLRGGLELLSLTRDEGKRESCLAQMMTNILGLQRLVQDLFELSRLQNTDFAIETSEMNLTDALQDAVQAARQLAREKGLEIVLPPASPILLTGDYGRLRQMFLTVLDNAVKFSPPGSQVTVKAQTEAKGWRICIKDQGCGIAAEELPHIFQRFRSKKEDGNREGTGLGLPIAKEIARRHGIEIECQSGAGEGTTFIFSGRCQEKVI